MRDIIKRILTKINTNTVVVLILLTTYGRGNILLINKWVFVLFSLYRACKSKNVILDQLLHVQCPIYRSISDRDTFFKVSQGTISGTAEIFVAITQFSLRIRFVTRVGDFPDEFSVISAPDGLLKRRTIQFNHFFWTNIHVYSAST